MKEETCFKGRLASCTNPQTFCNSQFYPQGGITATQTDYLYLYWRELDIVLSQTKCQSLDMVEQG